MSAITPRDARKQIAAGDLAPVYLVLGDDDEVSLRVMEPQTDAEVTEGKGHYPGKQGIVIW